MAVGTRNEQRLWLRRAVGHYQDTALVIDDMLDDALDEALLDINRHFSQKDLGSFSTVADQQTYTGLLPAGGYSIAKVYYDTSCPTEVTLDPNNFLWGETLENGVRLRAEPADALLLERSRSYFERMYASQAVITPPDTVRLVPTPTGVDTVYFSYWKPLFADVDEVTARFERPYRALCKYYMHNMLSVGRGAISSVASATGMTIRNRAAVQHEAAAKREYQRFQNMLPPLLPARNWMV